MIDDEEPVAEFCSSEQTKAFRITQLYLMFLFTWQGYFRVSDVGMGVILRFISMFLMLLVTAFGLHPLKEFVHQLPNPLVGTWEENLITLQDMSAAISVIQCMSLRTVHFYSQMGPLFEGNVTMLNFGNIPISFIGSLAGHY